MTATTTETPLPNRRKHYAGFMFGALLALLPVAAGVLLNPSAAVDFTGGRYELLLIALTIGLTIGHYLGLGILGERSEDLFAAVGAFLTISISFIALAYFGVGVTGTLSVIAVLFISMAVLIFGYYSEVIVNKAETKKLVTWFAEEASPLLLSFVWLLEAIIPPVLDAVFSASGLAKVGDALLTGLTWGRRSSSLLVHSNSWTGGPPTENR